MIRLPKNNQSLKLNVFLKSGEKYKDKDTTNQPFGENGKMVSFWMGNVLRIYPLVEVRCIEMIFEGEEDNKEKYESKN